MPRIPAPLTLTVLAVALVAVPTAFAKGRDHRAVRIHGTCTQQSTSELKLRREHRRIEVEFEVDQNVAGVPWTVTLSRNGDVLTSFTATTRAPSGSFEIRRLIAGRIGTDRITAVATDAAGETCTADTDAPTAQPGVANPAPANAADDNGNDDNDDGGRGGDDHGHHSGGDD